MTNEKVQEILLEEFNKQKEIRSSNDWQKVTKNLLHSLSDVNLLQIHIDNPNSHRLEKLEHDSLFGEYAHIKGGVCELNPIAKERILSDLYLLEIGSFYPTVIKQLIESNILDTTINFNKVFLTIFYFRQHNRRTKLGDTSTIYSSEFHTFYKVWINYVYGIISNPNKSQDYRFGNTINITEYTKKIFRKIITNFTWVYVDTDEIYCYLKDKRVVSDVFSEHGLTFGIKALGYSYFKSKKKFFITDGKGNISFRGIKQGTELEAENELKILHRDDRINEILN
tara:strand:+ start:10870 stop:11715 length:846 start_codon:yes stop_codon:yes gene_type:complete